MTRLYPVGGGPPAAWSRDGRAYFNDEGVLGFRDEDVLYSEAGESLGWFSGDDFFANDGRPVYFARED